MQKLRTAVPRDMMILGWNHEMERESMSRLDRWFALRKSHKIVSNWLKSWNSPGRRDCWQPVRLNDRRGKSSDDPD